jgi:hypothetical protein
MNGCRARPRTRWQRAWPTHAVEPAGCVAPVGSIQEEESVQHRSPRFFLAVSTAAPS